MEFFLIITSGTITAQFKQISKTYTVVIEYFYWDSTNNIYKMFTPPSSLYFYDSKTMKKITGGLYYEGVQIAGDLTTEEISAGESPTGKEDVN